MDPNPPPSPHSNYTSFPILLISIIGILTTAILLLSYYIFVIKCCLFRFRRLSRPQFILHHPIESRGLHISTINSIPTVRFTKATTSSLQCAICLIDFREQEILRLLPNCAHAFHLDCIDTWLQNNANCPLCRAEICLQHVIGATFSVPITQEESSVRIDVDKKKLWKTASMDDECIHIREKDERFEVEPIRRSFSVDSSNDRMLYVSVQEILRQDTRNIADGRISRRSLFSFGRSSRRASVLPV